MTDINIILIITATFIILMLFISIKMIPQGERCTVERFGRYTRILEPGFNMIFPIIERIGKRMNVMEKVLNVPTQEVITKDNASISCDAVAFYQILNVAKASYQIDHLENAILNLTMTNIRSVMGSMDLDELLSNRESINENLLRAVDEAVTPWGVKVTRVEIKDISPPNDLIAAMARQMKAEREKRAQVLEAEGLRNAQILRAEGAKQAAILKAEGQREVAFRDAEARERLAEAEAIATRMISDAIANGDIQALNYFIAQKYIQALANMGIAQNSKLVLMPMEFSSIIGSLGGISAIMNEIQSTTNIDSKKETKKQQRDESHIQNNIPSSAPRTQRNPWMHNSTQMQVHDPSISVPQTEIN
ncbi:Putative stomatin/prohibitin-family membrane protease subunit YbbK [Liberibacter crescens BT-1]|uniref:Putative stomatin/prohibitin-family membrane protease subunit YbbK n=1 Tax=Liberibacter crescens (strain BT-1) TaxID=1215343 RepID=L0EW25_LIBCB|nr:SPFH domain-containing protein [Liberibacter crescens]AGA64571.1 Putative stomatin/prohibitin-family membrane protease subunit YbbK [Liberibacter crescens BT-1]